MRTLPRVFISYKYATPQFSHEVQALAAELTHFHLQVILDQQELSYGGDIRDFMQDNITTADVMLVIVTQEFNRALESTQQWGAGVRFEVECALARLSTDPGFRVIPVLLDASRPIGPFSRLKAIDLSEPAQFRQQIARLAADLLLVDHPGHSGGLLAGRYRVDRLIEQRGMTHIFVGYDTRLSTDVEVYRCSGAWKPGDPERLQLASRIARGRSSAHSPFLLNYRDFLPYTNAYELVTERFEGPDLEVCLSKGLQLPSAQVCLQACLALMELHNAGIVHGGLVPRALRIGRNRRHATVKIVDFEFATLVEELNVKCEISGYPMAMPPERWAGQPPSEKGDVYQLGVLLFRLLTGQRLLNRATIMGMPSMARLAHVLIEDLDDASLQKLLSATGAGADAAINAKTIRAMTSLDPDSRPSGQEAAHLLLRLGADPTGYSESLDTAQQRITAQSA
jgi:hypothetical protein